jgi:rhodanese-related sulfurtransferase
MKTKYLGILFIVFSFFSSEANINSDTTCYQSINCGEAYLLNVTGDIFIIDVRAFKDYKKERIQSAFWASNKDEVTTVLEGVDRSESIYVYCYMGVKSKTISRFICKELNFPNVYNISGGIGQWKKKGLVLDKTKISKKKN